MATTPSTTASSSSQPSPHDTSSGSKMVTSTTFANSLDWIGTPATAASFAASVPVGTTATSVGRSPPFFTAAYGAGRSDLSAF